MEFIAYGTEEADDYLSGLEESEEDVFFHASDDPQLKEILPSSVDGRCGHDFGGLFADSCAGRAWSGDYGPFVYEIRLGKKGKGIAQDGDIRRLVYGRKSSKIIREYLPDLPRGAMWAVRELLCAERIDALEWDWVSQDIGDADWILQCIRGSLAKEAKYQGISEDDGYLIFPGSEIILSRVQTEKAIALMADQ